MYFNEKEIVSYLKETDDIVGAIKYFAKHVDNDKLNKYIEKLIRR